MVRQCITELRAEGTVQVVDVASGPGGYVLRALAASGSGVTAVCRDVDERSLAAGRRRAEEMGLAGVRFERGHALDAEALAAVRPSPNLVIAVGLYELFEDDAAVQGSMRAAAGALAVGGLFLMAHQRMESRRAAGLFDDARGVPQKLTLRSAGTLARWLRDAGLQVLEERVCAEGWYLMLVARKGGDGPGAV
jgi:hypothetical protein